MEKVLQDVYDAKEILEKVYDTEEDYDLLYRKHYCNPFRIKKPLRFYYDVDKKVGVNGFLGMKLRVNGNDHWITQSCDTGVLKDYRGRGIFSSIIKEQESTDAESEYIIGLPNEQSYPGFLKMGFKTIAQLSHFVLFIKPFNLLLGDCLLSKMLNSVVVVFFLIRYSIRDDKSAYSIRTDRFFSEEECDIINKWNECSFIRTTEYYSWKTNNLDRWQIVKIYENNEMIGFVAGHVESIKKGKCLIVDDWNITNVSNSQDILFRFALHHMIVDTNLDMIEVPLVNMNTNDSALLKRCGFINVCKKPFLYRGSPLIVSPRGKDASYLKQVKFRNIDKDTF